MATETTPHAHHRLLMGGTINLTDLAPDVRALYEEAHTLALAGDTDQIAALVYSEANPLVVPSERGEGRWRWQETGAAAELKRLADDLIQRARYHADGLDPETAWAQAYTLTVDEVADQHGVSRSTILKAVQRGEINAMKQRGQYLLEQTSAEVWRRSSRGAKKRGELLVLARGSQAGSSCQVKHDGEAEDLAQMPAPEGRITMMGVTAWTKVLVRIIVKDGSRDTVEVLELAPATSYERIQGPIDAYPMYGKTRVANAWRGREAIDRWKEGV